MKHWLALLALAALVAACGNTCNHHECDVDTFAAHCDESGNLVSCQDETTGEPCALSEGCDTYVTTTACSTSCQALTSTIAVCADGGEVGNDYDAGGRVREDAGVADASIDIDDSGDDDDASDANDDAADAADD
jgi:hypothetical protein